MTFIVPFPIVDTGMSALIYLRNRLTSMHVQVREEPVDHVLSQCHDLIVEKNKVNRKLIDVRDDVRILEHMIEQKRVSNWFFQWHTRKPRMLL